MPICYYTCNLVPLDLVAKSGYTPVWLGNHLRSAAAVSRRDILSVHPMTCPYVTKLVAAADDLFAAAATHRAADVAQSDCLVVPAGCDAMRRLGDLLAANYPERVFVLSMPRSSGPGPEATLAAGLRQLDEWLASRLAGGAAAGSAAPPEAQPPSVDYPAQPRHGGVFLVTGPLSDASLLRLID